MTLNPTPAAVDKLLTASDEELYALIGLHATPLVASPDQLLDSGRRGAFRGANVLGAEGSFSPSGLVALGRKFLLQWAGEIRAVVCGNVQLREEEKKATSSNMSLFVNSIVVTITAHITVLAPYSGLVLVVAVMIGRTGLKAFCSATDGILPEPTAPRAKDRKRKQSVKAPK